MRDRPRLAAWWKEIPTWLKAAFGLITTIAAFIITFRENWRLYTMIAVILILGYLLAISLHVTLARRTSRSRQSPATYRYGKYRPLGLIGLAAVLMSFLALVAFQPARRFALDGILGTQTPSPTPTLIPTVTPTPLPQLGRPDILLAEFDARHATRTVDVAHRLENKLQAALRAHGCERGGGAVARQRDRQQGCDLGLV
jgi:hypothetical protein